MAKIKSKPPSRKGAPPPMEDASDNLTNKSVKSVGTTKDLNFKVDIEFKKRFKSYATNLDISMRELLINAFEFYEAHNK